MQLDSKSSMQVSKIISQTNFSALSSLPRTLINQINAEGEIYMQAPIKCQRIWRDFRKQDFTSVQLTFKMVQQIFRKNQEDFQALLKLTSEIDFFDLFDQDNDGFLNEDEQILVFSVIKEKMSQVANYLLKIQQYAQFKQLMIQLRILESDISNYQDELRKKIYSEEVKVYKEIGIEKLDDFYDKYYTLFTILEASKSSKIEAMRSKQNEELFALQEKLQKNTEFMKVKPKRKLKDLQAQEKLVSLDERVEEALDFRRELKEMEKSEQLRVQSEQEQRIQNQRDDLIRKQQKSIEQLKIKLEEQQHKLIIQMKKEYIVLLKQIGLHSNEIERIQTTAIQSALKKGSSEGELKRNKERTRLQNFIIGDTKKINKPEEKPTLSSPRNQQLMNQYTLTKQEKIILDLKNIIQSSNLMQFYIKKKYGADLPVNFKAEPYLQSGDNHQRIEKILSIKKKSPFDVLPSLTELYDQELNPVSMGSTQKSEIELQKERQIKKAFILEKLQDQY